MHTTPVPIALPLSCTFEVGTECFLKDAVGSDDFDWTILSVRENKNSRQIVLISCANTVCIFYI